MRNLSLGIMIGVLICMCMLTYFPLTETDQACGSCGAKAWYFQLAKGDK